MRSAGQHIITDSTAVTCNDKALNDHAKWDTVTK